MFLEPEMGRKCLSSLALCKPACQTQNLEALRQTPEKIKSLLISDEQMCCLQPESSLLPPEKHFLLAYLGRSLL